MPSSDNEWDVFVGLVSSDRAVLNVLLRGARKRHELDHERRPEAWPKAVREVVTDAFSDAGVLGLLREKMKLLLSKGKSQRAPRTNGRRIPSSRSKNTTVSSAFGEGEVAAANPPSVVPNNQRPSRSETASDTGSTSCEATWLGSASREVAGQELTRAHRCCCSCSVDAHARRALLRDSHQSPALLSPATIPLFAIDSHDTNVPLLCHGEGKVEDSDESTAEAFCEDKRGDDDVHAGASLQHQKMPAVEKADDNGSNKRTNCHVARPRHVASVAKSKKNDERDERHHGDVPSLFAKEGHHHPEDDIGGDLCDSSGLELHAFDSHKTHRGEFLPLPDEKQCSPPLTARLQHEEVDSSCNDPSGAIDPSGTAAVIENVVSSATAGTLPPVHVVKKSNLPERETSLIGSTLPSSAGVLAGERPFEVKYRADFNGVLGTSGAALSSSSSERQWSDETALAPDNEAMGLARAQRNDKESIDEERSQPGDGNTGISTTESVVFSDDQNLSETDASANSLCIGEFALKREVEDPEQRKTKACCPVPATVKKCDKEQTNTEENSAAGGALPTLHEPGTVIAIPAGGGDPETQSTSALEAQIYSPDTTSTDDVNDGEYEFTFDEDDTAIPKSVQFSDESLWRVHEVRASFEKHELPELFYTSAELDVMVEEAEREEALEQLKNRQLREEKEHQNDRTTNHDGSTWLLFGGDSEHKMGVQSLPCDGEDSDYEF